MLLRSLIMSLAFVFLIPVASQAALILRVDIGRSGQDVESGFTGFSTSGSPPEVFETQSFSGGTWDLENTGLSITTRNYGDIPISPLGDLLEDSVLSNSSLNGGFFDLVFDDLAPGAYTLTTYHHSFAFGGARAEVLGALEGDAPLSLGLVTSTTGTDLSDFATFTTRFTTTSGVDGYTLRFDSETAAGSFHFDLSGFELDVVPVPEPTAAILFGFGLAGLATRGRAARRR